MIKGYIKYVFLVLLFLNSSKVFAQKDFAATDYYNHEHTIFPAATGVNYYPVLAFTYQKQWTGLPLSPQRVVLNTNFRLGQYDFYTPKMMLNKSRFNTKERLGLGVSFKQDRNGPLKTSNFITSYAYHLPFPWATASLGLDLSYNEIAISQEELSPNNPNDPYLFVDNTKDFFFQSSFGIQLTNDVFFVSIAARNLFKNEKLERNGFNRTSPDFYLHGGYSQHLNKYLSLEPSFFAARIHGEEFVWEANMKLYVRSYNWCSINYTSTGSVKANIVLRAFEKIQIGYGYEYFITNLSNGSYSGHSIHLGRNFGIRNIHGIRKNVKQKFL